MKYKIITDTAMDKGRREIQQDAVCMLESGRRGFLAVLSDGIGGMESGEAFSEIATDEMKKGFETGNVAGDLCARLETLYEAARSRALEFKDTQQIDGGATVIAVLIRNDRCAFLSVGDSRIYLYRGGGLIQLNREHTYGKMLDEMAALGRIPREEARNNIYRKALTNNLTEMNDSTWDICAHPLRLQAGDRLVLMSDGVFGALDDERLVQLMPGAPDNCAHRIIEAVRNRDMPRQDNNSAIVISLEEDDSGAY